jgi:hypothetical protein
LAAWCTAPTDRLKLGFRIRRECSISQPGKGELPVTADGITIAEGIAVKTAGHLTRKIVNDFVDDIPLVEEASIEGAISLLQSVEKTIVEGAGAASLAAVIEHRRMFSGLNVALNLRAITAAYVGLAGNARSRSLPTVLRCTSGKDTTGERQWR